MESVPQIFDVCCTVTLCYWIFRLHGDIMGYVDIRLCETCFTQVDPVAFWQLFPLIWTRNKFSKTRTVKHTPNFIIVKFQSQFKIYLLFKKNLVWNQTRFILRQLLTNLDLSQFLDPAQNLLVTILIYWKRLTNIYQYCVLEAMLLSL